MEKLIDYVDQIDRSHKKQDEAKRLSEIAKVAYNEVVDFLDLVW